MTGRVLGALKLLRRRLVHPFRADDGVQAAQVVLGVDHAERRIQQQLQ